MISSSNVINVAYTYIKKRKFEELMFRCRLVIKNRMGNFKYKLYSKIFTNKYRIVDVNGYQMYVNLDDNGISRELLLYKLREKFATDYFKDFINDNDVILEIGANIGYYALLENQIIKNGKIFAFEPMTFNRKLLEKNLKLNKAQNIEIYPFALGNQNKEQEFYIYDKINWASFNKNIQGKLLSTEIVKTLTIDYFVEEYAQSKIPTVIRMDVEGYELNVIKGSINTIKKSRDMKIFMEIHPHLLSKEELEELINILKENNFQVKAIMNECPPHFYSYFDHKIWKDIKEETPYGLIGNSYESLIEYLQVNKGTEVFFEKSF